MREALKDPDIVQDRRWLTLLVLCISLIVITLDNTILNVALPTLSRATSQGGLGATASQLQWTVDAYTLVFAGLLLTAGSLGDRFGRYRFLTIGLAIFGLGSLLSAFETDYEEARTRYGVFGTPTVVFPNGEAIYLKIRKDELPPDPLAFYELFLGIGRDRPGVLEMKRPTKPVAA